MNKQSTIIRLFMRHMRRIQHDILPVLIGVYLIFHFLVGLVYSSQGKYTSDFVNGLVAKYVLPVFHRDWHLFAPDPPTCQFQLWSRYQLNNQTALSSWFCVGRVYDAKHQGIAFGGKSKLFRLNEAYARALHEHRQADSSTSFIKHSRVYNLALEYSVHALHDQGIHPDQIQLAIGCVPLSTKKWALDTLYFPLEKINALHE